jgi:hypothetical protein
VVCGVGWRGVGRWLRLKASEQRARSLTLPVGERGLGEVGTGSPYVLGSGGGVVEVLLDDWGCLPAEEGRKEGERISSKISSGSSPPLCPSARIQEEASERG